MDVLVKIIAAVFGLIAGLIATIVMVALLALGLCLMILVTPIAAVLVIFGVIRASRFSGGFRSFTEWCFEKISEAWRALVGRVLD